MRTLLLPARLAFIPARLLLYIARRRRSEADMEDLAEAMEELADLDADEVIEAVEAVVGGTRRSRRATAARGVLVLVVFCASVAIVLYLLRQRRDHEYARLVPEPERPDLTPTDPIAPLDSDEGPAGESDGGPGLPFGAEEADEEFAERTREPAVR